MISDYYIGQHSDEGSPFEYMAQNSDPNHVNAFYMYKNQLRSDEVDCMDSPPMSPVGMDNGSRNADTSAFFEMTDALSDISHLIEHTYQLPDLSVLLTQWGGLNNVLAQTAPCPAKVDVVELKAKASKIRKPRTRRRNVKDRTYRPKNGRRIKRKHIE